MSASVGVGMGAVLTKALGIVRTLLTAFFFGAGPSMDAFVVASTLPTLLMNNLGAALATVTVPMVTRRQVEASNQEAINAAQRVWRVLLLGMCALVAVGELVAPWVVRVLAPGLEAETAELATLLFRLMLPMSFGFGTGLLRGLLNSFQEFTWPALGEPLQNAVTIAAMVILARSWGILGLGVATVVGVLAHLVWVRVRVARLGFSWAWPRGDSGALRGVMRATGLTLVATSLGACNLLLDRGWASGIEAGAVAALNYGLLLMALPMTLVGTTLGTVALPTLAKLSAREEWAELAVHTRKMLLFGLYLLLPVSAATALVSGSITRLVLGYGAFSSADQALTANVLVMYVLGLPALAWGDLLLRLFLANEEYQAPLLAVGAGVLTNSLLNAVLVGTWGAAGLALATSVASWVWALVLTLWVRRRGLRAAQGIGRALVGRSLLLGSLRIVAGCVLALGPLWIAWPHLTALLTMAPHLRAAVEIAIVGTVGVVLFGAASCLLRMPEEQMLRHALSYAVGRLGGRFRGGRL